MRAVIRIMRVPRTATAKRQPKGVAPNRCWPMAIVHLPSGGWTTNSGSPVNRSRMRQLPSDPRIRSLASSTIFFSNPESSMPSADFG